MHPLLASRLPFMGTSSLLQVAWLQGSFFPGPASSESVGVVTYKKSALVSERPFVCACTSQFAVAYSALVQTTKHLTSVGAHPETPVYGLPEDDQAVFKGVLEERIPCTC